VRIPVQVNIVGVGEWEFKPFGEHHHGSIRVMNVCSSQPSA
jgi:hypothetical protein